MARPGIQYEDVKNAALALLERGANPSIQRIREVLGTGSNSTIADHLKRWQIELAEATPRVTLPAAIPETLSAAVEAFWAVALRQAEAAYQQLRSEAERKVAAAEQECAEAVAAAGQARTETTVLQERWAVSQQEARVLADQLLLEQERRSQAEAAIHAAEQRTDEARRMTEQVRADTEARISQLEDLSQRAQEEAERRVQEAAQRLSAERAQSETHQQHLMRVIEQNHVETAAARKAFDEERLAWKNQEGALLKRLDAVHAQLAASELRVATTEERARLLETELVQARAALRELREHQLTSSRVIESLRAELALTQTQCADLRQRLSEAQSHSAAIPLVDPKQNHETG